MSGHAHVRQLLALVPPNRTPPPCVPPPHSLRKPKKAIADGLRCVELEPSWGKGYSRLGAAYFAAGKYPEAVQAYARGLAVEPTLATLTSGLAQAQVRSWGVGCVVWLHPER